MASPSTVLTLGYGSFGGVNLVPTIGYGASVVEPPDREGLTATLRRPVGHYTLRRQVGVSLLRPPNHTARE